MCIEFSGKYKWYYNRFIRIDDYINNGIPDVGRREGIVSRIV